MKMESSKSLNEVIRANRDPSPPKIKISISEQGNPIVWDSADCMRLRQDHRIVGSDPTVPIPCSPVILEPWETTLLLVREEAELVPTMPCTREREVTEQVGEHSRSVTEEQNDASQEECTDTSEGKKEKLTSEPRKKKRLLIHSKRKGTCKPSTSVESSVEAEESVCVQQEISRIKAPSRGGTSIRTSPMNLWLGTDAAGKLEWRYPTDRRELICYRVFENLWTKGNYITPDRKYGGDFLVHKGDPSTHDFHSIVVCTRKLGAISQFEVERFGRLGATLSKPVTFATLDGEVVEYRKCVRAWNPDELD